MWLTASRRLAMVLALSGSSTAQAIQLCPPRLEYAISVPGEAFETAVRVDFQKWIPTRKSRFRLLSIGHYGRHPSTETALVLPDFEQAQPIRRRHDDKSENGWIVCSYEGTDIQLMRILPQDVSYCQYDQQTETFDCLYHAPSEPETLAHGVGQATSAQSPAVLVIGSVRECQLKIDGIHVGPLLRNRDRAFNVAQGTVWVECVAKDGAVSRGRVDARMGEDVPYRVSW